MKVILWLSRTQVHVCTYCMFAVLLGSLENCYLPGACAQLADNTRSNSCSGQAFLEQYGHAAYLGGQNRDTASSELKRATDDQACRRLKESPPNPPDIARENEGNWAVAGSNHAKGLLKAEGDKVKSVDTTTKKGDLRKKKFKGSKKQRKKNKKKKMGKKKKRG